MVNQAKIEVVSRHVDAPGNAYLPYPYQHLFLLYSEQQTDSLFISAQPKDGQFLTGQLDVAYGVYTLYYQSGKENKDFKICTSRQKCFFTVQVEDNLQTLFPKWQKMIAKADYINARQIPYNIPFLCKASLVTARIGQAINSVTRDEFAQETLGLPNHCIEMYLCNTVNSNTVIAELLKEIGIDIKLPTYPDGVPVKVPGINSVLDLEKDLEKCVEDTVLNKDFKDASKGAQKNNQQNSFDEALLSDALARGLNFADRAIEAQHQMQEEGVRVPPSTGNYMQDALDVAQYSQEILRRAGLLGEDEQNKEEL